MQQITKESVTLPMDLALALHAAIGALPSNQFGKLFVDFTDVLIQNEQAVDEPPIDELDRSNVLGLTSTFSNTGT